MTIDLATAKSHLRVETADEDALIGVYLSAAKAAIEKATGKLLAPRIVTQAVSGFPGGERAIRLWFGPVSGAVTIAYDDANGAAQTLVDYRLVEGSNAQLLPAYGDVWPSAQTGPGTVRLSYTAGYAAADVPPDLDQAVLLTTAHFYLNREAVTVGSSPTELPLGVDSLVARYRPVGIG